MKIRPDGRIAQRYIKYVTLGGQSRERNVISRVISFVAALKTHSRTKRDRSRDRETERGSNSRLGKKWRLTLGR